MKLFAALKSLDSRNRDYDVQVSSISPRHHQKRASGASASQISPSSHQPPNTPISAIGIKRRLREQRFELTQGIEIQYLSALVAPTCVKSYPIFAKKC